MNQDAFDDIENFIDAENNNLEKFIEKIKAETKNHSSEKMNHGMPTSEDIEIGDLADISDYQDFVFEDALEIIE